MFDKISRFTNFLITRQLNTSATMANSLGAIVEKLNNFAAIKTAESWDNVGLLIEPATPKCVNASANRFDCYNFEIIKQFLCIL